MFWGGGVFGGLGVRVVVGSVFGSRGRVFGCLDRVWGVQGGWVFSGRVGC